MKLGSHLTEKQRNYLFLKMNMNNLLQITI